MRTLLAAGLLLAAFALPATAQTTDPAPATPAPAAPVSAESLAPDAVKRQVETAFGVTVLRVRPLERPDGTPAYAVTVMAPPEAGNAAFGTSTLEVDGRTGALVPQFHHTADGYALSGAASHSPNRSADNPAAGRGRVWH